jgi:hypothetical protein
MNSKADIFALALLVVLAVVLAPHLEGVSVASLFRAG